MRRGWMIVIAAVLATSAWLVSAALSREPLAALVPGEPLVAVVAPDLPTLAARVRQLPAAEAYLQSRAHDAYRDSKLGLKLADRAKRLGKVAGMELTLATLLRHAGSETVLAVYDIGELSFLLLVRMSPAEQAKLAFVERRGDFTERVYEGRTYRGKIDPDADLAFVFYQQDDLLMVADRVDLIEQALQAQAKPTSLPRLVDAERYRKLLAMEPAAGAADALLWLDMAALREDRYFRAYWAWQNFAELQPVEAALVGFACDGKSMSEKRVLLAPAPAATSTGPAYDGPGLVSYVAVDGEGEKSLAAHLGWPLTGTGLADTTAARVLVAEPYREAETGVVRLRLGAVVAVPDVEPSALLQQTADRLRRAMPHLPASFALQNDNGVVSLRIAPELTGAYAARRDNLLFLANDRALLDRLRNATKPDGASMREALRVDGEAANLLADFLRQAGRLDAAQGEGATFAVETLPLLLEAVGKFDRMNAVTQAHADGWRQETTWR